MRRREDFALVVRRGRRAGRRTLAVHYLPPEARAAGSPAPGDTRSGAPTGSSSGSRSTQRSGALAGFVVSRAVGGSVVRHRVLRRLRHLMSARLGSLPGGAAVVVRALPAAAAADSEALGRDLDAALSRLLPAEEPVLAGLVDGTSPASGASNRAGARR